MNMNISNSNLIGSAINVGDGNKVIINNGNIYLEILRDELGEASEKLPRESKEYKASKAALTYAEKGDHKGLINYLKSNRDNFVSNIFTGAASGILVEILKNLL